jgi:hypothetical protein
MYCIRPRLFTYWVNVAISSQLKDKIALPVPFLFCVIFVISVDQYLKLVVTWTSDNNVLEMFTCVFSSEIYEFLVVVVLACS